MDRFLEGRDGLDVPLISHHRWARRIQAELREAGTPERAGGEKRYLKSDLAFLGSPLRDITRVAKSTLKNEQLTHDDLIALVHELWRKPVFDLRMAAVILLELRAGELGPNDLPVIERLIRQSRTWALVDGLAGDVVSEIALRMGSVRGSTDGQRTTTSGSGVRLCSPS
jgi:3-methyladenine DNA glycosylase AlkD